MMNPNLDYSGYYPFPSPILLAIGITNIRLASLGRVKGHEQSEDVLRMDWVGVDLIKRVNERPFSNALGVLFRDQEREAKRVFRTEIAPTLVTTRSTSRITIKGEEDDIASKLFNISFWKKEVEKRFGSRILSAVGAGFETALGRMSVSGVDFTSDSPGVTSILEEVLSKTKGINDTVLKQLTSELQEGLTSGEDLESLFDRVGQTWKLARSRIGTITQTAITPAFEVGQKEAYAETGIENNRWLSRRDGSVRRGTFDHFEPDGQTVKIEESFLVSGESLRFPGDPLGALRNIIGCRCSTQPVL